MAYQTETSPARKRPGRPHGCQHPRAKTFAPFGPCRGASRDFLAPFHPTKRGFLCVGRPAGVTGFDSLKSRKAPLAPKGSANGSVRAPPCADRASKQYRQRPHDHWSYDEEPSARPSKLAQDAIWQLRFGTTPDVHVRNGKDRAFRPPQLATVLSPPLAFPALSSWQCPSNGCPVFFREHVRIEVGDPLLAFLRDPQIPECVADIGPDDLPEESRVRCA